MSWPRLEGEVGESADMNVDGCLMTESSDISRVIHRQLQLLSASTFHVLEHDHLFNILLTHT